MRRIGIRHLALPLLAAATLAATSASAGVTETAGGIKYKVTKRPGNAPVVGDKANCPNGTFVIGGGFLNTGPFDSQILQQSSPRKTRRGWEYVSDIVGVDTPHRLYGSAICDEKKPSYESKAFSVQPNSPGSGVAECPGDLHVYSGGAWPPHGSIGITFAGTSSYPVDLSDADSVPDDGWAAFAENYDNEDQLKLRTTAICGKRMPDYVATPGFVSPDTQGGQVAACGQEKPFLYGGGQQFIDSSAQTVVDTTSVTISDGQPIPGQWTARVDNHGTGTVTLIALGVCGKALK